MSSPSMPDSAAPHVAANVERFMGFADTYAKYRPTIPTVILDILTQLAHAPRPRQVVDIGSGTGLSTYIWADRAEKVIGVEPSDDMRHQAEAVARDFPNVSFRQGLSSATGLPDSCADIVTISQALHWMEPVATFAEVARLLRPGGVFAAIDNDWPPTIDLEAEAVYRRFMSAADALGAKREVARDVKRWAKHEHLSRIEASGHFRHTKEVAVHSVASSNAAQLFGLILSQGATQALLKGGVSEEEIGLPTLRADLQRVLGDTPRPLYFTYRVRIGMK